MSCRLEAIPKTGFNMAFPKVGRFVATGFLSFAGLVRLLFCFLIPLLVSLEIRRVRSVCCAGGRRPLWFLLCIGIQSKPDKYAGHDDGL